jgi:hypothetical protein
LGSIGGGQKELVKTPKVYSFDKRFVSFFGGGLSGRMIMANSGNVCWSAIRMDGSEIQWLAAPSRFDEGEIEDES